MKNVIAMQYVDAESNSDKVYVATFNAGNIFACWGKRSFGFVGMKTMLGSDADYSKLVNSKLKKGYVEITDKAMLKNIADGIVPEQSQIFKNAYNI